MNMASKFWVAVVMSLLATVIVKANPNLGLAAYWDFDEGSGTVLHDQSGNGNDGTIYGATWQEGVTGTSLSFNGINNYVSIGNKLNDVTVPYSVTAWIKLDGTPYDGSKIIFISDNSYNYYGFLLAAAPTDSGSVSVSTKYGDGGSPAPNSRRDKYVTSSYMPNIWLFIAAVVRGPTDMSLYLDGTEIAGTYYGSGSGMAHSSGSATIGGGGWLDEHLWFRGGIDELRIYNRALDSIDVQELYELGNNADPQSNLWNLRWFGCDCGHDNSFTLNRDGTPVCGSGNCSGTPGTCWNSPITAKQGNMPGVIWTTGDDGSLDLTFAQDMQVYGDTYLYANEAVILEVPVSADVGHFWLNDVEVSWTAETNLNLNLIAGINHLEWTGYNQNAGGWMRLPYAFSDHVTHMWNSPIPGDLNLDGQVDLRDYTLLAPYWLIDYPPFDIAPPPQGDGIIDWNDMDIIINNWLVGCD
jgi:hypothetical protein